MLTFEWWENRRKEAKQELLDAGMETVRLLGELYSRGEFTPENAKMVYERERLQTQFLREEITKCEEYLIANKGLKRTETRQVFRNSEHFQGVPAV